MFYIFCYSFSAFCFIASLDSSATRYDICEYLILFFFHRTLLAIALTLSLTISFVFTDSSLRLAPFSFRFLLSSPHTSFSLPRLHFLILFFLCSYFNTFLCFYQLPSNHIHLYFKSLEFARTLIDECFIARFFLKSITKPVASPFFKNFFMPIAFLLFAFTSFLGLSLHFFLSLFTFTSLLSVPPHLSLLPIIFARVP